MLGKLLFRVSAFVITWVGIVMAFRGYVVPGVACVGVGYTLFEVTCSDGVR